jgi:hypothetical protein
MKTKKIFSKLTLSGFLISFLTPLAIFAPQASAAADTCTWTGGGTPVVDSTNKTITFDIADSANWSGCDNGTVPESGDSLEFPANFAQVDPGNSLTDDSQWKYFIDNTLPDGTTIAGMMFNGDTGSNCRYDDATLNANNDTYFITGNDITLTGNVINTYSGDCNYELASILLELTLTANTTIDMNNQYVYAGSTYISSGSLDIGAYQLTLCDPAYSDLDTRYLNVDGIIGDGNIVVNCGSSTTIGASGGYSTGRNLLVNDGGTVNISSLEPFNLITLSDESSLYVSINQGSPYPEVTVPSDIVIQGGPKAYPTGGGSGAGGGGGGGTPTYTQTQKNTAPTNYPRINVYYNHYDSQSESTKTHDVKFTGDLTFTEDVEVSHNANVNFAGKIEGNEKTINSRAGSAGLFKITSSDNTSATPNGTQETNYTVYEIDGDYGDTTTGLYDMTVQGGFFYYLKTSESSAKDVIVNDYAKFGGVGTVANLTVQALGILAPGLSPGCLSSGNLVLSGTYEVELAGTTVCTEYDQTDVTGTVDVTGATLDLSLLNGFSPPLNSEYIIINNDGSDAVTGEFAGLVDGASITQGDITFQINYDGGDGNDVVLTVTGSPTAATVPDTGIGEVLQSPYIVPLTALLGLVALFGIRRLQTVKK